MSFSDHFSRQAQTYSTSRPTYPDTLWARLAQLCPSTETVVDVGAGNGQASIGLAGHFDRVLAVEPSDALRGRMTKHPRLRAVAGTASDTTLPEGCAQLVVAAQAAHWFDLKAFSTETRRLLQPRGVCALVTYALPEGKQGLTAAVKHCYTGILGPDWPPERVHVDNHYRDLALPFASIEFPSMRIELRWNVDRLLGYLRSWSAAARYQARTGIDPAPAMRAAVAPCFDGDAPRPICYPLTVVAGRVGGDAGRVGGDAGRVGGDAG